MKVKKVNEVGMCLVCLRNSKKAKVVERREIGDIFSWVMVDYIM